MRFWAVARYHGAWGATPSETKTVVFESHGRLDAPTFDCGTTFARGQTITITRTNDVPNAQTCLAFLSTLEHNTLDSRNFNGEATVTMTAPDTPGTYVVSVCVMATGWNNNQTDLEITVTDSEAPAHPPISITLSGRVMPSSGTLTVTATAEGAQRVRICEGNAVVTFLPGDCEAAAAYAAAHGILCLDFIDGLGPKRPE